MRTSTAHTLKLLVVLGLFTGTGAGCGELAGTGGSSRARAQQVADAWDGSEAAEVWSSGYYPMGDLVQLPANAFRSEADKRAYLNRSFLLRGTLPAAPREDGQVTWGNGTSLTRPLLGPRSAYESLGGDNGSGPHLVVTGVKLDEMTLSTSRGPATVPAWFFSLRGYDTPLKRVALVPSAFPEPPVDQAQEFPTDDLRPLEQLTGVAGDGRAITVTAAHGSCDDGPAVDVLETKGSVVLSASVTGGNDGICTDDLRRAKVTVKLDRALGERVILDAFTGQPVAPADPNRPSMG